jgi:hypothetical protein
MRARRNIDGFRDRKVLRESRERWAKLRRLRGAASQSEEGPSALVFTGLLYERSSAKGGFGADYPLNAHKNLNTRSRGGARAQWLLKKGDPIAILRLLIFDKGHQPHLSFLLLFPPTVDVSS